MRDEQRSTGSGSALFMLRLWPETLGSDYVELRAEVRHVQSGEVRYFRDWDSLLAFLVDKAGQFTSQPSVLQPIDG